MILAVAERDDNSQVRCYFLDTEKLSPENYVDLQLIEASSSPDPILYVNIDAMDDGPLADVELDVSQGAKVNEGPADKIVLLTIQYE
jgi:hypothetical protein